MIRASHASIASDIDGGSTERRLLSSNNHLTPKLASLTSSILSKTENRFKQNDADTRKINQPPNNTTATQKGRPKRNNYTQPASQRIKEESSYNTGDNSEYEYRPLNKSQERMSSVKSRRQTAGNGPYLQEGHAPNSEDAFQKKIDSFSKMPTIHEMAKATYCPPPLFFHKVRSLLPELFLILLLQKVVRVPERLSSTTRAQKQFEKAIKEQNDPITYSENFQVDKKMAKDKKRAALQKKKEDQQQQAKKPNNNFIVLNNNATKDLLQDRDFQLQMNNGTLLDILLQELGNLRQKPTQGAGDNAPIIQNQPFKIVVEHQGKNQPQQPQKMQKQNSSSSLRNGKTPIINNNSSRKFNMDSSIKESIYSDSMGGNNNKHKDKRDLQLESIQESIKELHPEDSGDRKIPKHRSSANEFQGTDSFDDFESYNVSQSKEFGDYNSQSGNFGNNHSRSRFNNQNGSGVDRKSAIKIEESFPNDFDSYSQTINNNKSRPGGSLKSSRNSKFLVRSESKPSIQCIQCQKAVIPAKIREHLIACMKQSKQSDSQSQSIVNDSVFRPRMKSTLSQEFKDSYPDDFVQASGSKSSLMGTNKKSDFRVSDSKLQGDTYEDDFESFNDNQRSQSTLFGAKGRRGKWPLLILR